MINLEVIIHSNKGVLSRPPLQQPSPCHPKNFDYALTSFFINFIMINLNMFSILFISKIWNKILILILILILIFLGGTIFWSGSCVCKRKSSNKSPEDVLQKVKNKLPIVFSISRAEKNRELKKKRLAWCQR